MRWVAFDSTRKGIRVHSSIYMYLKLCQYTGMHVYQAKLTLYIYMYVKYI